MTSYKVVMLTKSNKIRFDTNPKYIFVVSLLYVMYWFNGAIRLDMQNY